MKRVLLINSPIYRNSVDIKESYLPPLGLGYIATALNQAGVSVTLLDAVIEQKCVAEIKNLIAKQMPDFVGINLFTQNFELVRDIIEHCPSHCELIIGGQVVKSVYQHILKWNVSNPMHIIIGEGEWIIPAIVQNKCTQEPTEQFGNKTVYSVVPPSVYFPQDISECNLDYRFFKNTLTTNHYGELEGPIITSRGCPHNCAFCGGARALNHETPVRFQSINRSAQNITTLLESHPDMQSVRVLDDLFLGDAMRTNQAIELFSKFPFLHWRAMIHALSLKNNLSQFEALKTVGCKELFMGIESGSQHVRQRINKSGTVEDVLNTARAILENGIDLKGYFMFGLPKETQADFEASYQLAKTLSQWAKVTPGKFRSSVFQFRPYHGTQLYNDILNTMGYIPPVTTGTSDLNMGRAQFNFNSGNYSDEPDETLNLYIEKTQKLSWE